MEPVRFDVAHQVFKQSQQQTPVVTAALAPDNNHKALSNSPGTGVVLRHLVDVYGADYMMGFVMVLLFTTTR
jgi:hypothetical protein